MRKGDLDNVMVRRLKEDVREIGAGFFPKRIVRQIDLPKDIGLDRLPEDTPELLLSRLLDQYRAVRQQRMAGATKRKQAEAALLISGLQQRLLSSVEAFARTLAVHRRTMERIWNDIEQTTPPVTTTIEHGLLASGLDSDDDRSQLTEEEQGTLIEDAFSAATLATAGNSSVANIAKEKKLLTEMQEIAEKGRGIPDARIRYLSKWIKENMCEGARVPGEPCPHEDAMWSDCRFLE